MRVAAKESTAKPRGKVSSRDGTRASASANARGCTRGSVRFSLSRCAHGEDGDRRRRRLPRDLRAVRALSEKDRENYSPAEVLWPGIEKTDAYLRKLDFRAKKSLGQNFMVQEKVLTKVAAYSNVKAGDRVLEIGSGTGNLTRYLLGTGAEVHCMEKDDRLFVAFEKEFSEDLQSKRLNIVHADVMRWLAAREAKMKKASGSGETEGEIVKYDKIVANLPFNITTDLLKFLLPRCADLFRSREGSGEAEPCGDVLLLLQDEAAQRLCQCSVGDHNYRAMNVLVDCYCSSREYLFKIDRKAFFPAPNVDGAMVHFKLLPHSTALSLSGEAQGGSPGGLVSTQEFQTFVNQCFSRRRKMVKNNIPPNMFEADHVSQAMAELDLKVETRPQEMSKDQYLAFLYKLQHLKNQGSP